MSPVPDRRERRVREMPMSGDTHEDVTAASDFNLLDLDCPSCGADLLVDESFLTYRVCGSCDRHFAIAARERVARIVDSGRFDELAVPIADLEPDSADPLLSPSRRAQFHDAHTVGDAVVTGLGRIGGIDTVVVALDDALVGSMPGALLTDKIIFALDHATTNHLPLLLICAGSSTPNVGPLASMQTTRLASAFAQVHLAGVMVTALLVHPVSPDIYGAIAAHADVVIAEPGVQIGTTTLGAVPQADRTTAEQMLVDGWVDAVVPRPDLTGHLGLTLDLVSLARSSGRIARMGSRWPRRSNHHPEGDSAQAVRLLNPSELCDAWIELRGDRVIGDDRGVIGGVGRIDKMSVVIAQVELGQDTLGASAARKVSRLARFAGRMELPLVLLLRGGDRPVGPATFAPERVAAASSVAAMLGVLPVPIVTIGLGRLGGWLAPSLLHGDRQYLHASANVVVPGGSSAGLPSFASRIPGRSGDYGQVLTASACERLGLIDAIMNGDADDLAPAIRSQVLVALDELAGVSPRRLVDGRLRKVRALGLSTPEGVAAIRLEMKELQEWQRSVGKSIDDLRERWEHIRSSQQRLSFQKPDMSDIAARIRARRSELLERARSGDRS